MSRNMRRLDDAMSMTMTMRSSWCEMTIPIHDMDDVALLQLRYHACL